MTKTGTVRARAEPGLKRKAEEVFGRLGLTTTQAITLFCTIHDDIQYRIWEI